MTLQPIRRTASPITKKPVSSYLAFSPLDAKMHPVLFCCTFPEVAFGGRYPLSLSVGARTFLRQHLSVVARDRTVGREKNNDDLAA